MAEAAFVEADQETLHSPLVSVSFQKNEQRKFKFLEGEPKALGITQMCMSVFHISCVGALFAADLISTGLGIPSFLCSLWAFFAGSVAMAAKNLHLPTLRACLGMEVVAGVASLVNLIFGTVKMMELHMFCYRLGDMWEELCRKTAMAHIHLFVELTVIHVTMIAISVTLVVYAAKVINCCGHAPKVPVITIQASPAPPPQ